MSESFVDLSYRGLALGKRIKLTQVRPTTGYLEMPTPMPVGTTIGIATDDGLQLEAVVTEIHEQVGGSDRPPGMLVRPELAVAAADTWWRSRVDLPAAKIEKAAPPADESGKVIVAPPRMSGKVAVPEVEDDGRSTAVMAAMDGEVPDMIITDGPSGGTTFPEMQAARDSSPSIADDGKRTQMMDAVDLAALGLANVTGQMAAVRPEDYADEDASASGSMPAAGGDKPEGKTKKKRKRR